MTILTFALATVRETVRRRVVAIAAILSVLAAGGVFWGFVRLTGAVSRSEELAGICAILTILLSFAFSVVVAVGSSFLAAPAIAGDIESGVALAILPRPISRASYVAGKWLGLAALVTVYTAVFGSLAYAAVAFGAGYRAPHEGLALLYLVIESVALLTLALALSTRLPPIAAGIIAVSAFGFSWIAGITNGIARGLGADALATAATVGGLLVPTDGLWRGALYALSPITMLVAQEQMGPRQINPFGVTAPPSPAFLAWSAVWILAMLGIAISSLRTRDV